MKTLWNTFPSLPTQLLQLHLNNIFFYHIPNGVKRPQVQEAKQEGNFTDWGDCITRSQGSLQAHLSPLSVAETHAPGAQTLHCHRQAMRALPHTQSNSSNSRHIFVSAVSSSSPSSRFLEVLGLLFPPNDGYVKERMLSPSLSPVSSIPHRSGCYNIGFQGLFILKKLVMITYFTNKIFSLASFSFCMFHGIVIQ